jgi:DNA-binding transcriptional LysR family regulator
VDLDLAQVRAFLAAADRLHFGQAADDLSLSQQALSKRIARLEAELGVQLFLRGGHTVGLTEAGHRFLEPARQAVAAGDRAVAAAQHIARPLRIDYFGHLFAPMRTLRQVLDRLPDLPVEAGPGRDLPTVASALERAATDVGFGRLPRLSDRPSPGAGLAHRLVRLEPVDLVVGTEHRLADRSEARPTDLRTGVLWCPAALERLDFYQRFAEAFGIATASSPANLGLENFLDQIASDPTRFALLPADIDLPDRASIRCIPLVDPTPLYAWSLLWRGNDPHPGVEPLLRAFADIGGSSRWLEYRPGKDWLPEADLIESAGSLRAAR